MRPLVNNIENINVYRGFTCEFSYLIIYLNIFIINMGKMINYSIRPGLILISALFLLPLSCNKNSVTDNPGKEVITQLIKVSGEDSNSTTKTTLNGLSTSWIAGTDKVGIYSSEARTTTGGGGSAIVNTGFTAASSGASSSFTGTMCWGAASTSHTFYAYYPYSSGSSAAIAVPVSLRPDQTQSAANNSEHIGALDFMVATPLTVTSPGNTNATSGVNLRFNHLFTVLEFQIKGAGDLKAVSLQSSNPLSFRGGTIDITQSTPADGTSYNFAGQTETSKMVTTILTTPAALTGTNTDNKVYMVINPSAPVGNCVIGLQVNGEWRYLEKAVPAGGFKRGIKYAVAVNAEDAAATTISDVDGNVYKTVRIGTQVWMAENLKATKYNDGTPIPNLTDNSSWGSTTTGAWCDYNNTSSNSDTYGKLYNWYTVDNNAATKVASNGGKNICPVGWHVPSDAEWTTLTDYVGYKKEVDEYGDIVVYIYGAIYLRESGTTHWASETGSTNSSGFTALPGGYRKSDGWGFESFNSEGYWWSSSSTGSDAISWRMTIYTNLIEIGSGSRTFGRSVRCLKD